MPVIEFDAEAALEIAALHGLIAEGKYPGLRSSLWDLRCAHCQRQLQLTLNDLVEGEVGCLHDDGLPPPVTRKRPTRALYDQLPHVRMLYKANGSIRGLAEEYGVSYGTMYRALSGVVEFRARGGNNRSPKVRDQQAERKALR